MAGWGGEVFSAYNHWWIIPLFSCHMGAILGAVVYLALVELHWPPTALQQPHQQQDHQLVQQQQKQELKDTKTPSLVKPGFGSNFLNVSFIALVLGLFPKLNIFSCVPRISINS